LLLASLWMPPLFFGFMALLLFGVLTIPTWRARLRWRLPGFQEASLAPIGFGHGADAAPGNHFAGSVSPRRRPGAAPPVAKTLAQWRALLESGQGKPTQWPVSERPFPPLFLWLVRQGGEDIAAGFQKAADLYQQRASYRTELLLYGALPLSHPAAGPNDLLANGAVDPGIFLDDPNVGILTIDE
jgi:hypothetical protein